LKKKIALLFTLLLTFPSLSSYSKEATFEKRIEKEIVCPKDFTQNPAVYFYCIYRDYHNYKFDDGIEKAQKALKEIEPLLKKSPEAKVPNAEKGKAKLRDPRVKSVASDLHLLLGMLYFQKAVNLKDTKAKKVYEEFFSKLEKKGFNFFQINELMELYAEKTLLPESFSKEKEKRFKELLSKMGVTEEDLESLVKKAQKFSEETAKLKFSYLQRALKEFQTAVKIDPENALAYYQLGNFYSGALGENLPETSQAAEEAYYKAALLLKKKGDLAGYKEVVKKLEMLNPSSQYLKKLKGKDA